MSELSREQVERLEVEVRDTLAACTCIPFPQGEGPMIDCPTHGQADYQAAHVVGGIAPTVAAMLDEARAEVVRAVEREYADEFARLAEHEKDDPRKNPLLGNWLGGIKVARDAARKVASAAAGAPLSDEQRAGGPRGSRPAERPAEWPQCLHHARGTRCALPRDHVGPCTGDWS